MRGNAATIKVLVVDDHDSLRQRIVSLLQGQGAGEIEVIDEAADGYEAMSKTLELAPDVLLMDINMPGCTGLQAAQWLRDRGGGTKVLLMSATMGEHLEAEAKRAGACGYISKTDIAEKAYRMIRDCTTQPCLGEQQRGAGLSQGLIPGLAKEAER